MCSHAEDAASQYSNTDLDMVVETAGETSGHLKIKQTAMISYTACLRKIIKFQVNLL